MFNQTGGTTLPAPVTGWGPEIALDIEWAHAIAPHANIDNRRSKSATSTRLVHGGGNCGHQARCVGRFDELRRRPGILRLRRQSSQYIDQTYFQAALAANPNVTFLASTGDTGADPRRRAQLSLAFAPGRGRGRHDAQSHEDRPVAKRNRLELQHRSRPARRAGGGGISNLYTEPVFQQGSTASTAPASEPFPTSSADADPKTGVAVYDPSDFGASSPVAEVGGTSLSSPTWAGFIAIADQGRVLNGLAPLGGPTQTLPALYSIPASDYHDITVGYNNYNARPGYDLITGRGTPIANKLIRTWSTTARRRRRSSLTNRPQRWSQAASSAPWSKPSTPRERSPSASPAPPDFTAFRSRWLRPSPR